MTNKEKALKLFPDTPTLECLCKGVRKKLIEMAEWKEQQFRNILKQKLAQYHKKWELSTEPDDQLIWGGKEDAIGLLLVELFGEDSIDYSDGED